MATLFLLFAAVTYGRVINIEDVGAVPDVDTLAAAWVNGGVLNATLALLSRGDTLLVPNKTFHVMGGIKASGLHSVEIRIDGTVVYNNDIKEWPRAEGGRVLECMHFENITNVTFTSSHMGLIDGNGDKWWGPPLIGYAIYGENRPRILAIYNSKDLLVENLFLKDSPYWTFWVVNVDGLEVRNTHIDARRTKEDRHTDLDMTAFNTDGFDVTGRNVWIHDCSIWNQDDSIAVKDGSENMLFERIHASGVGLTIGSISGSVVRNITFRDCHMHHTYKGIYLKFRGGDKPGLIEDVLYENIYMEEPEQWPVWIGPAQQSDSVNICAAHPCSICWPEIPGAQCNPPAAGSYRNITLRNITVVRPKMSPGVIYGNSANPMRGVTFEDVRVISPGSKPWHDAYYKCESVEGVALGSTWPVPPCFKNQTQ